jgi:DNA helicase II / ATP-dependent DNA helicase PcrA
MHPFIPPARTSHPFDALNPAQHEAVFHAAGTPLLVIAGAGSGKTMTLACRVAHLVIDGADPRRLLLLTFSRRAAQEMARRIAHVLHQALGLPATSGAPALPWCGTFHSIAARLLRDHAARIGLAESFTILDRGDAEDLMGIVREELVPGHGGMHFPQRGTCLAIHSRVINTQQPLDAVLHADYPWCKPHADALKTLMRRYMAAKQAQQVLDYDDLLLYWQQMMAHAAIAQRLSQAFDHVLVDEYQDTNRLQASLLAALKPDGRGLTVVGDDAQSIYAFRGATVENILQFPQRFDPPAHVVPLARNYRSTQAILTASNAVIALAEARFAKDMWTEGPAGEPPRIVAVLDDAEQAAWVADEVLRQRESGLRFKQQAVLFRTGHHSAALELELARRRIPFVKYGGLKFLEAAHVKDTLAVLRWVQNPAGRLAGFRVATLLPGFGPAAARRLLDAMAASAGPVDAMAAFDPPRGARAVWQAWLDAHTQITSAQWPHALRIACDWYLPHLERLHAEDAPMRRADLDQLVQIAQGFANRERFLAELTLDPPQATSDEAGKPLRDEDYLILSTMHSAKGQEWTAVTVLNAVDGCIPSEMATGSAAEIDEERRLLYVAMTRARRHLNLMLPQRFYITQQRAWGDKHLYASLTRFIPPAIHGCFEFVGPASAQAEGTGSAAPATLELDVGAQVRGLFD